MPDNIIYKLYPRVLKETKLEIVNTLKTVGNLSLCQGSVPVDWKAANITKILRKRQKYTRELHVYQLDVSSEEKMF